MVKVEIVDDKEQEIPRSPVYASSEASRHASTESVSSIGDEEESFYERIAALVDIVPPSTRQSISSRVASTASFVKGSARLVGNLVWIVTTSALLVGLPLALSLEDEAKIVAQEKEMLAQQQGAQQVRLSPLPKFLAHANMCPPRSGYTHHHATLLSIRCKGSGTFTNCLTDMRPSQMLAPSMYPSSSGSNPNQAQSKGIVPPGF